MYVFVIDTEREFSNLFSNEMTAYITGHYTEEYSYDIAQVFVEEMGTRNYFLNLIEYQRGQISDQYETKGYFATGTGLIFKNEEEREASSANRTECIRRANRNAGLTPVEESEYRRRWLARADQPLEKYSVKMSVGIFLSRYPTDEEVKVLQDRAKKFVVFAKEAGIHGPNTIIGFRLLEETTIVNELQTWEAL